ncbi:hypothetical protein JZU71_01000, partial [bacterium]|nr:hypothetical protein [bacterium]
SRQEKSSASQLPEPQQEEKTSAIHRQQMEYDPTAPSDRVPRLLLILGILVFGVTGQVLLRADKTLIGAIFTGLAALFFVAIFRNQAGPGSWLTTVPWGRQAFYLNWSFGGRNILGMAVLFACLAFGLFGEDIPAYYPWALHLLSIGLLIFSSFWINRFKTSTGTLETQSNNKKWNWLEVGSFLAILAIAAFMRLYRFDQIPFGLWYDEADNGLSALAILNQPEYLPVFVKSTNLPAHFLYLISFSFRILGVSALTIRAVSVVFPRSIPLGC